jgi:CheY-like chemotaxis protein
VSIAGKPLLGVSVLIVDDDDDTRDLFGLALEDAGADVRTASDAEDAMRIVHEWRPCIVVSDLSMPRMDGATLLRKIRSVDALRNIPAVAVSGYSGESDQANALAAGFQAHAPKPLAPDDLVALVKRWAAPPVTGER